MDLLTMRFNCLPYHFQCSFHWGVFPGENLPNYRWILDILNTANNCYMSWVWLDLQLISNQCSELHREPRRQFIWTNGSFGPIIGWLQSLLLIALVIAKIWLSNRILQERFATRGPCNLCRLSARLANSTYSWKNNQEDSGVLGSKSSQGAGKFSENSKCYQHRVQRGRASSSFLTDWVTVQKRRKPDRLSLGIFF